MVDRLDHVAGQAVAQAERDRRRAGALQPVGIDPFASTVQVPEGIASTSKGDSVTSPSCSGVALSHCRLWPACRRRRRPAKLGRVVGMVQVNRCRPAAVISWPKRDRSAGRSAGPSSTLKTLAASAIARLRPSVETATTAISIAEPRGRGSKAQRCAAVVPAKTQRAGWPSIPGRRSCTSNPAAKVPGAWRQVATGRGSARPPR